MDQVIHVPEEEAVKTCSRGVAVDIPSRRRRQCPMGVRVDQLHAADSGRLFLPHRSADVAAPSQADQLTMLYEPADVPRLQSLGAKLVRSPQVSCLRKPGNLCLRLCHPPTFRHAPQPRHAPPSLCAQRQNAGTVRERWNVPAYLHRFGDFDGGKQ